MKKCLILLITLLFLEESLASNCLIVALSSFANKADVERSVKSEKFWKLYKNDPQFEAFVQDEIAFSGLDQRYQNILNINSPVPQGASSTSNLSDSTEAMMEQTATANYLEETRTAPDPVGVLRNGRGQNLELSDSISASNISTNNAIINYELNYIERDLLNLVDRYEKISPVTRSTYAPTPPKKHTLNLSFNTTTYSPNNGIVPTSLPGFGTTPRKLMQYEEVVSEMRAGDTIAFPSTGKVPAKEFKIGKFLGAGNSTHVYELSEGGSEASSLIRIPATADFISHRPRNIIDKRVISTDGRFVDQRAVDADKYYPMGKSTPKKQQSIYDKDYTSYRLSWQYVNKRATSICDESLSSFFAAPCYYTVRILSHDPNYRWVEVEKINIAESYDAFKQNNDQVIRLIEQKKSDIFIRRMFPSLNQTRLTEIRDKTERLRKVRDLAASSGASDFRPAQLAWGKRPDTGEMDWILLDW